MKAATEKRLEEVMDLAECIKLGKGFQAEGTAKVQDPNIHVVSGKPGEQAARAETEWSLHRCQSLGWSAKP